MLMAGSILLGQHSQRAPAGETLLSNMKVIILLPAFGRDAPSGRIGKMPHDPKSACEKWADRSTGTSLHKEVLFFQRGICGLLASLLPQEHAVRMCPRCSDEKPYRRGPVAQVSMDAVPATVFLISIF